MTHDFREMIFDIQRKTGLTNYQIAAKVGIPPSTLSSLKNHCRDPLFSTGMALIRMHEKECGMYAAIGKKVGT